MLCVMVESLGQADNCQLPQMWLTPISGGGGESCLVGSLSPEVGLC